QAQSIGPAFLLIGKSSWGRTAGNVALFCRFKGFSFKEILRIFDVGDFRAVVQISAGDTV
ncbi:MAG: hypothetical protein ACM3Q4_16265, partial [Acidobacteriota bacterium]